MARTEVSAPFEDIEARLRAALRPVDPPSELQERVEFTLDSLVEIAADELDAWELKAMRDPRNWPRAVVPATAVVGGGAAAAGLVVLRTQRKRHKRRAQAHGARDLAARTLRDAAREAQKLFDELTPDR